MNIASPSKHHPPYESISTSSIIPSTLTDFQPDADTPSLEHQLQRLNALKRSSSITSNDTHYPHSDPFLAPSPGLPPISQKQIPTAWAMATYLADQGDTYHALKRFLDLIARAKGPDFFLVRSQLWANVGLLQAYRGDHGQAKRSFYRAVELNKGDPLFHFLCGFEHYVLGEIGVARIPFCECLKWMDWSSREWGRGGPATEWDYRSEALDFILREVDVRHNIGICEDAEYDERDYGVGRENCRLRTMPELTLFGIPSIPENRVPQVNPHISLGSDSTVSLSDDESSIRTVTSGPLTPEPLAFEKGFRPFEHALRASSVYSRPTTLFDASAISQDDPPPLPIRSPARLMPSIPSIPEVSPRMKASDQSQDIPSRDSLVQPARSTTQIYEEGHVLYDILQEMGEVMSEYAPAEQSWPFQSSSNSSDSGTISRTVPSERMFNSSVARGQSQESTTTLLRDSIHPSIYDASQPAGHVIGQSYDSMMPSLPPIPVSPSGLRALEASNNSGASQLAKKPPLVVRTTVDATGTTHLSIKSIAEVSRKRLQKVRRRLSSLPRPLQKHGPEGVKDDESGF